tara:strand:+ start:353 stop:1111 length:759 start_codon:yes stop_codon:yes gene_type:complete
MGKLDKSQYTKEQWKKIKAERNAAKARSRAAKEVAKRNALIEACAKKISKRIKDSKCAFVLGNGASRKGIDLHLLKSAGCVYGCNALYREFDPDYLVAVDTKMIIELHKAGYQRDHEVWTNPNKAYTNYHGFNYFQPSKGWSSGPTALWLSSQHDNEVIYILGFDYKGHEDGKRFNNIYADTFNYKKSNDSATYFGNWMRQTTSVIKENPKKRYIRVIEEQGFIPQDLKILPNLEHIFVKDLLKILEDPDIL